MTLMHVWVTVQTIDRSKVHKIVNLKILHETI